MHGLLWLCIISAAIKAILVLGCFVNKGIRQRCWIVTLFSTSVALLVASIVLSPLLWVLTGGNPLFKQGVNVYYKGVDCFADHYARRRLLAA